MQWIFIVGAIIFYLYKKYKEEEQKGNQKPLTPANKPIRQGQKRTQTPQKEVKTLEDIWRELKEASNQQNQPQQPQPKRTIEKPKKIIEQPQSIEYQDALFKTGELLDKIPTEEGGGRQMAEVTALNADYEDKLSLKKYIRINGKMLTPKDTFLASIIWERKY